MGLLHRFLHPDVERHLLADEGEFVIDEVGKHWVTSAGPVALVMAAIPINLSMPVFGPYFWFPLVLGLAALVVGLVGVHIQYMDRFVITNMRVFRVHGILSQHLATMPMTRILDISVFQPFLGRLLGYGHFTFESAAQDQGLRDIRYVGRPEERDLTIQRVIQRSGLRASVKQRDSDQDEDA